MFNPPGTEKILSIKQLFTIPPCLASEVRTYFKYKRCLMLRKIHYFTINSYYTLSHIFQQKWSNQRKGRSQLPIM